MADSKNQVDNCLFEEVKKQREENLSESPKVAKVPKVESENDDIPPIPLRKEDIKPEPFPIQNLDGILFDAAMAIHEKIKAPIEICAQSVLSTANLITQAYANIELPTGQIRPISNFFLTIAESGERKSSCDEEALKAVNNYEDILSQNYNSEYKLWRNKNEAWEKQRSQILNDKKNFKSYEEKTKVLNELPEQPPAPLQPVLICDEPTLEGLYKLLQNGQPSIGLFSDDGGQFVGGYSMKDENKLKSAAALSHLWDGKQHKIIRAGNDIVILKGKRFSMHLMIQKDVSRKLLSDPIFKDQGLLSRLLVIEPPSAAGKRSCVPMSLESKKTIEKYTSHLLSILENSFPLSSQNELSPPTLTMSKNATEMWIEFANYVEKLIAPGEKLETVKAFANKTPEHAARIASVLALTNNINTHELKENYLSCGIEISKYYANEILRLSVMGTIDPDILLAERLLKWLHTKWKEPLISLPDIYQRSFEAISYKKTALKIVKILEDHHWLVRIENGAMVKSIKRKDVWKIIKV
jgi:hypothetical protein